MNFGIIGFGNIARKFAKSIEYTKEGKVYAIGSKTLSSDDQYIQSHKEVVIYQDYDELLNDQNIDVVYIALPHMYHKEWILKALHKKIAVLSEKPAVLEVEDMQEIKGVAYQNQTYFLEALKTKFNDGIDALKKDIEMIGHIKSIDANFCFDALPYQDQSSYLFDQKQGGALNDIGSYVLGFVFDIVDSKINSVSSTLMTRDSIDLHFYATLVFENGITANIEGAIDETKERYAKIIGEKGTIEIPMFNRIIDYTISLENNKTIKRKFPIYGDDMTKEIVMCIKDIKENKIESDRHSMDDTIKILEITKMIRDNSIKIEI